MDIQGWKYYKQAVVPTTAPHKKVNIAPLNDGSIWQIGDGSALLARWTTDWDINKETSWWFVIKDTPFDVSMLKSKRRYEINKGNKNFDVSIINPIEYAEELYEVTVAAYQGWPEKYRPTVNHESFIASINEWNRYKIYGGFYKETGKLCSYEMLTPYEDYIDFNVLRAIPEYEAYSINAAMVDRIVEDYNEFIINGGYILDGSRSISHETAFQDYLEKYFGFRKAYCKLHIKYKPVVGAAVNMLYPFRKLLIKLDNSSEIHKVNGLLKMEEIVRS
jgi:hypothetical protein